MGRLEEVKDQAEHDIFIMLVGGKSVFAVKTQMLKYF